MKINGLSLFAGGGIGEMGLKNTAIDIKVANELLPYRAAAHKFWHPNTKMIEGDITNSEIKSRIIKESLLHNVKFVLITPPCQGVSLIGKNKNKEDFIKDKRNFLLKDALDITEEIDPDYILIENVPRYEQMMFPIADEMLPLISYLENKLGDRYKIDSNVYNAVKFEIPQSRNRLIIKIYKKHLSWPEPTQTQKIITVEEAIGHLPSLEAGESSSIKNHSARNHVERQTRWLKHTPTGCSAMENTEHYPKNQKTGEKIKSYKTSYSRIRWDEPAPTITVRNDAISSQRNVHPGRPLGDGTWSDARVLTLRELFILSSIDPDLDLPPKVSKTQVRHIVGESVPPKMIEKIVEVIKC